MLNKNPTIIIPKDTTPTNVSIKGIFKTFLRIIISGSERPITDIINANAVPNGTPFSILLNVPKVLTEQLVNLRPYRHYNNIYLNF